MFYAILILTDKYPLVAEMERFNTEDDAIEAAIDMAKPYTIDADTIRQHLKEDGNFGNKYDDWSVSVVKLQ